MISATKLTKSFGSLLAVDHVDLQVNSELFVFLGPNGAGKTTTIKMLTGLLRPDFGGVKINGVDLSADPVLAKRQFGYAPEQPTLYEKLTAREFVDFVINIYSAPYKKSLDRMEQLFDIFEINERADDIIEDFSNGMKKKVSLIAALVHKPKILFLDEPTASLDPKAARNLKDILRGFVDQGGAVFMTTHILETAEQMCDRIGIINKGRLCAMGSLEALQREQGRNLSLEALFLKLTGEPYSAKVEQFLQGR